MNAGFGGAIITTTVNPFTGATVFTWSRRNMGSVQLRRIFGGMGWPGAGSPGALVVLGEEVSPNRDWPDQHCVHVLGEWQDWQGSSFLSAVELFAAMAGVQRRFFVQGWWCQDRPEFDAELRGFNRVQQSVRRGEVRLSRLPDEITPEWLYMRVHHRTSGRKTLWMHGAEGARRALLGFGRDFSAVTWRSSPAATALLAALYPVEARPVDGVGGCASMFPGGWST